MSSGTPWAFQRKTKKCFSLKGPRSSGWGLCVTYISDLRLQLVVTPVYEMQFKPSYLLGLNELVGLRPFNETGPW